YGGEIGDVVVGRIVELAQRRWKVDINGRQDAILTLAAVNLPGGELRRRSEEDELQMRSLLREGDMISAEIQAFFQDGAASLHTRSFKYGKLRTGTLVTIPAYTVKRSKTHFVSLACGVDVVLGVNGNCWVTLGGGNNGAALAPAEGAAADAVLASQLISLFAMHSAPPSSASLTASEMHANPTRQFLLHSIRAHCRYSATAGGYPVSDAARRTMARVCNSIRALAAARASVSGAAIQRTHDASVALGLGLGEMVARADELAAAAAAAASAPVPGGSAGGGRMDVD
ncbi:Exosome complex component RRP4, partial [Cladochytrium tenue]